MARIRTIKPEFWSSEQVVDCSPTSRLLFIGMWNFCDDGGNCPASCRGLKMQVFPGDDFTADDIRKMMDELVRAGLVLQYFADGKEYWHVTGWQHQKIEKKAYKYPQPHEIADQSPTSRRPVADNSPPDVDVDVDVDRKGEERRVGGEEKRADAPAAESADAYLKRITTDSNSRTPVTMSTDWKPSEQFKALLMRAGVKPDALTDELLAKFQIHHNGDSKPQNKWESALVTWCKRERYQDTAAPSNAPRNASQVPSPPIGTLELAPGHTLPPRIVMAEEDRKRAMDHIAEQRKLLNGQ